MLNEFKAYLDARDGKLLDKFDEDLFRICRWLRWCLIKNDPNILEIGSGPGQASENFVKNQYNITGLEISEEQVQFLLDKYSEYHNFNLDSKGGKIVVLQEVRLYMAMK